MKDNLVIIVCELLLFFDYNISSESKMLLQLHTGVFD